MKGRRHMKWYLVFSSSVWMFVLRTCCMCGLNQSCVWEVWPCLKRKRCRVRGWSSGSDSVQDWEPSLQCCSSPSPATSGRRIKGKILFLYICLLPFLSFFLSFSLSYFFCYPSSFSFCSSFSTSFPVLVFLLIVLSSFLFVFPFSLSSSLLSIGVLFSLL